MADQQAIEPALDLVLTIISAPFCVLIGWLIALLLLLPLRDARYDDNGVSNGQSRFSSDRYRALLSALLMVLFALLIAGTTFEESAAIDHEEEQISYVAYFIAYWGVLWCCIVAIVVLLYLVCIGVAGVLSIFRRLTR